MTEIKTVGELINKLQEFDPDLPFNIHMSIDGKHFSEDCIESIYSPEESFEDTEYVNIWAGNE